MSPAPSAGKSRDVIHPIFIGREIKFVVNADADLRNSLSIFGDMLYIMNALNIVPQQFFILNSTSEGELVTFPNYRATAITNMFMYTGNRILLLQNVYNRAITDLIDQISGHSERTIAVLTGFFAFLILKGFCCCAYWTVSCSRF
jgi:hypothetical protein